jgi:NAD+ kinase
MEKKVPQILFGGGNLGTRSRIQCIVKSTFSETRLVPALNDMLIANPSPGEV